MKRHTVLSLMVALFALSLVVAGCGGGTPAPATKPTAAPAPAQGAQPAAAPAAAGPPLKVGVIGPMTGASADLGLAFFQGITLAADEINGKGGLNGRKIELVQADDQADPSRAVTIVNKMIFEDKIITLLGPTNSGNAQAVKKIANDNKVLMLTNGIVQTILDGSLPYVFRITAQDTSQNEYVIEHARKVGAYAVLHDTSGFGEGMKTSFLGALSKKGMPAPVAVESYQVGALDLQPQLLRIKNAGAKVLIWYGAASDGATVGKTMQRLGITLPFMGNNGMFPSSLKIGGTALDGYIYADTVDFNNPGYKRVADMYMKKHNTDRNFSQHEVTEGYDGMNLLMEALKKSGGKGGEDLLKAVESGVSFQGATGKAGKGARLDKAKRNSLEAADLTLHYIKGGNYEQSEEK